MLFRSRFVLMLMLSILFDIRDRESDLKTRRKTIATIITERQLNQILIGLVIILLFTTLKVIPVQKASNYSLFNLIELTPIILCFAPLVKHKMNHYYFWAIDGLMIYIPLVFYINLL